MGGTMRSMAGKGFAGARAAEWGAFVSGASSGGTGGARADWLPKPGTAVQAGTLSAGGCA